MSAVTHRIRLGVLALVAGVGLAAALPVASAAPHRPAAPDRPAATGGGWHFAKPYRIPHMRDAVNGLACPTAKECIAVSANKVF